MKTEFRIFPSELPNGKIEYISFEDISDDKARELYGNKNKRVITIKTSDITHKILCNRILVEERGLEK